MTDEFVPVREVIPEPIDDRQSSLVEDMMWFGLVPGLVINLTRGRKNRKDRATPLEKLVQLHDDDLEHLKDQLDDVLDQMRPPERASPSFVEGYMMHVRLMRWMAEKGDRGKALRRALDEHDTELMLEHLGADQQLGTGFFLGFQAANGDLARMVAEALPDTVDS